jgi:CheY-like chemotaxis protein/HPt (histidine-containing phosphotransfer) domain-containing protein
MKLGDEVDGFAALGRGRKALVVDDNLTNRLVLSHVLRRLCFDIVVAEDGAMALEAVEAASEAPFSVILMDCRMPGLDGFDATRLIRARELELGLRPVPVVAVTASDELADRVHADEVGMDGFVVKPVAIPELTEALTRVLADDRAPSPAAPEGDRDGRSRRANELVSMGGEELLRQVYAAFLEDARTRMQALMTALAHADAKAMGEIAHALKGSSLNVGAGDVADAARRLEVLGKRGTLEGASTLVRAIHKGIAALESELHAA